MLLSSFLVFYLAPVVGAAAEVNWIRVSLLAVLH